MQQFDPLILKNLYIPPPNSHKGDNGKVLIVGGSKLFHAASLWALSIASRIVDMVFYASVPENNEIVLQLKKEFRDGIIVPRDDVEHYAKEADCILVGPGLMRGADEGEDTYFLTKLLLEKFTKKRFVLDAGSLQMMEPEWLLGLKQMPILTPHRGEFNTLFKYQINTNDSPVIPSVEEMAKKYHCVILLKGKEDIICSPLHQNGAGQAECVKISGGNAGMTKGGTGDVLAGLTAGLYAQNTDPFLAAQAASFFNKKAGESLFERVGYYFNASDLVKEIPKVMREYLIA